MLKKQFLLALAVSIASPLSAQFATSAEKLEKQVCILASDSLLGRGFGTQQGRSAARYIAEQFRKVGIEPLDGDYFHPFNHRQGILNIPGVNVAGIIPGSDTVLNNEYIVLGAHYDHLGWMISEGDTVVYNGADDNASGTASITEIGRNLSMSKESLGRSIIFVAFDGEESGLVGSRQFLRDSLVLPEKIKLMVGLDMVGMYKAHGGLDLHGVKMLNDHEWLTEELAATHHLEIKKANGRVGQRTDTAPFGNMGIPAVHVFTGTKSPYHKPEDVADSLDYEGMALIADYLSDAVLQLSAAESLSDMPGPKEDQIAGSRFIRPGVRLRLGSSHHNYLDEFFRGKSIFATQAGLYASLRAASFLTIQPELLYETRGSEYPGGNYRTHSVTVPLNLLITTPDHSGMVSTYLQVGGYYSYHFAGKAGGDHIDFQDTYHRDEYGLTYGFGFEIMRFQYGIYFQRAFSGLYRGQDEEKVIHEQVYFLMGFTF